MPSRDAWRVEVGRFRATHPQRTFPLEVHLGVPAGDRVTLVVPWPVPAVYDVGQRLDLATVLVGRWRAGSAETRAAGVCGWVGRVGVPEPHDEDHAWHAAALRACEALGVALDSFHAVTKNGWLDVRTGERRRWARLRLDQP